jgi:hypothetical protein
MDMNRTLAATLLLTMLSTAGAQAAEEQVSLYQKYVDRGQKAFDNHNYKTAATLWQKALKLAEEENQPTVVAATTTKVADALAQQGKYPEADGFLQRALQTFTTMGGVTPYFANVYTNMAKSFRLVDPQQFGNGGAKTLNDNSAKVSVRKADEATHVQIDAPARFTADAGNDKVDQVGFEKAVSFDLKKTEAGNTVLANIKGLRVHLVEKNMWVSLLNMVLKDKDDAGDIAAEVTGAKAGFTKTVETKLPGKVIKPVEILQQTAMQLETPATLNLPMLP